MIIDVHCHYALTATPASAEPRFSFEQATRGDEVWDSCVSPRAGGRVGMRFLPYVLGLPLSSKPGVELDHELAKVYDQQLSHDPAGVARYVLLAFDHYHDDAGRCPPLPERSRDIGSDMYTANSLVRALCRAHPERFLFGASVHPYRADAVGCIDEVFEAGACLLKWIPLHQNVDYRDPRTRAVLRRCAELGLPVLVHHGEEFTLKTQHKAVREVDVLLETLRELRREGAMPITIVPHVATPASFLGNHGSFRALVAALLGEFRDAPLYADISALTAWGKVGLLRKVARMQELHGKLLFGTDFPVPLGTPRLRGDLGHAYRNIRDIESWPQQALRIYRHLGFNEIVFHRAAELLPNVDYFASASADHP